MGGLPPVGSFVSIEMNDERNLGDATLVGVIYILCHQNTWVKGGYNICRTLFLET